MRYFETSNAFSLVTKTEQRQGQATVEYFGRTNVRTPDKRSDNVVHTKIRKQQQYHHDIHSAARVTVARRQKQ